MAEAAHGGGTPHNPSLMAVIISRVLSVDVHHVKPYEEAIAMSVVVAIGLAVFWKLMTRNLNPRSPSRLQAVLEKIVEGLDAFVEQSIGHDHRRYLPLVGTLFLYIVTMNLLGLVPALMSPTSSASVTAGLAICVFLYVQAQGIRVNGFGGYIRHFMGEPLWLAPLNFPIHVIGELARPLSLTLRLFGNIFGEDLAIVILMTLPLVFFPIQFFVSLLAVFTSFVQALVFCTLTCAYLASITAHEEHGHGETALEHASHEHPPRAAA